MRYLTKIKTHNSNNMSQVRKCYFNIKKYYFYILCSKL